MKKLKKYRLFSEWRNAIRIGESLKDALIREGSLRESDSYSSGSLVSKGETHDILKVLNTHVPDSTRGSTNIERATVEMTDGRIREVDAELVSELEKE